MKTSGRWVLAGLTVLAMCAPLKFGTPVVLSATVPPQTGWEWALFSWPNQLLLLGVCGLVLWSALDPQRPAARRDGLWI